MRRGVKWTLAQGAEEYLPKELLKDPEGYVREHGKVISEGRRQLAAICDGHGLKLFVKVYRLKPVERLKFFFRNSRAEREWEGAKRLQEAGVPVPRPFAWGRESSIPKKTFFVAEALQGGCPLKEKNLGKIMPLLAKTVRRMHDTGIFHKDFHPKNILIKDDIPYIIHLHRHRLRKTGTSISERLWDIACLLYPLKSPKLIKNFMSNYGTVNNIDLLSKIENWIDRAQKRHLHHLKKDCLKSSNNFRKTKIGHMIIFSQKTINTEEVLEIISKHKDIVDCSKKGLVKDTEKSAVTIFYSSGRRICVKEFRYLTCFRGLKEFFRFPKPRKAWLNANLLVAYGIKGIKPLALVEHWRGIFLKNAFLIYDSPEGFVEFHHYVGIICQANVQQKRRFLDEFVKFLFFLRDVKIWHKDFKTHHIMVCKTKKGWQFCLIDSEDVVFTKWKTKYILRSLRQMETSLQRTNVRKLDKIRFIKRFTSLLPLDEGQIILNRVL